MDRSRRRRRNRVRAVVALLAAALGVLSAQAPARAPGVARASLCANAFDSYWSVTPASSRFKIVRTGTWQLHGGGSRATATETDAMLFTKQARINSMPLGATESCSPWELSLQLSRPAVQDLSGQWSQPAGSGSPSQGTCHAHHRMRQTTLTDPLTVSLVPPNGRGVNVFFKNNARHVKLVVGVGLVLPGLKCQTPFGTARFDFPVYSVNSSVVTLPVAMLKRDQSFTLRFSGSSSRTESWLNAALPGASEHFDVTWSGTFHFRAAGCQETFFAIGKTFPRCYPG